MKAKELKTALEFLLAINPDAVVYFQDGRDGESNLTKITCRPIDTGDLGNEFHLEIKQDWT
jgi:hypothetical protein